MNRNELEKILPHRPPMLLLDESEVVDGETHGRLTIHGDESTQIGRASCRERV